MLLRWPFTLIWLALAALALLLFCMLDEWRRNRRAWQQTEQDFDKHVAETRGRIRGHR